MPKTCPKCEAALTEDAVFCHECGHKIESDEPDTESSASSASGKGSMIGEGAKVTTTGDVVGGDYKEGDKFYGTTNIVKGAESDELKRCEISRREVKRVDGRDCPECDKWICFDEYLEEKHRCTKCEEEAEGKFTRELEEVYADGIVEPHERRTLKRQATELNIDIGRSLDLEKPFRHRATKPLGDFEEMELENARKLLFEEMDPFASWETLKPVFEQHKTRDDEVGEKVRSLYLLNQIEINPAVAKEYTQQTLEEYDDPHSYLIHMEFYERKGDVPGVKKAIGEAEMKLPGHACVQGAIMKHCLDQNQEKQSKNYLEMAKESYNKIKSGKKEPFIPSLIAYFSYSGGESDAFKTHEEKEEDPDKLFYLRKLKAQLNTGRLNLEINSIPYPCHHGDVLGRSGDVARGHLSAIGTIHGKHAEILCCFGQWYIRPLPNTKNPTYIDQVLVEPGKPHKLTGEHRLRLAAKGLDAMLKIAPVNPNKTV